MQGCLIPLTFGYRRIDATEDKVNSVYFIVHASDWSDASKISRILKLELGRRFQKLGKLEHGVVKIRYGYVLPRKARRKVSRTNED